MRLFGNSIMTDYKHFTVKKDEEIVDEISSQDGRNDKERLVNWAKSKEFKDNSKEIKEDVLTEGEIESKIKSMVIPRAIKEKYA